MKKRQSTSIILFILLVLKFSLVGASPHVFIPEHNIYLLSPHFDDVPLTFGGLILTGVFIGKNNNVINFFKFVVFIFFDH